MEMIDNDRESHEPENKPTSNWKVVVFVVLLITALYLTKA